MADPIIRICAREGCDKEFSPKPKGMKQIYCSSSCRSMAYHATLPRERVRQWWNDYYYRNQAKRQALAREMGQVYRNHLCECGTRKPSADAEMCDACAAMPSVNEVLKG